MVPDAAAPIEAGRARSKTPARRPADRDRIATQKAVMREAVTCMGLQRHETQVLEALIDIWQPGGGLFPEQATIAARALYGERRTRAALKSLREDHELVAWVNRRYRGVQTSNLYQFTPKFWALVRALTGATTEEKQSRLRAAKDAFRRRQRVPTNGDLPGSDLSSLNGEQQPEPASISVTPGAAPPCATFPSPDQSSQEGEDRASPSILAFLDDDGDPAFDDDDDPAFVKLTKMHRAAHAKKYRATAEETGGRYDVKSAGTIRKDQRAAVAEELRNLAGRAHAFAIGKHREDLTPEAIRIDLTKRIVNAYMAQERTWLLAKHHPLGGLWGQGGDDGKPCDLKAIAPRVWEEWCNDLEPGEPTLIADVLAQRPPVDELDASRDVEDEGVAAEARAACAEFRAMLQHLPAKPHEAPPQASPHIERRERGAKLRAFLGHGEEPRPLGLTLEKLQAFASIVQDEEANERAEEQTQNTEHGARFVEMEHTDDLEAREHLEHDAHDTAHDDDLEQLQEEDLDEALVVAPNAPEGDDLSEVIEVPAGGETGREQRRTTHGGRVRQGTTARERTTLVAALAALGGSTSAAEGLDETDEADEASPLLRDVRERPQERAPRRRRRPPPERS